MKKNLLSIIALACAVLALACSVFACVTTQKLRSELNALQNASVAAPQSPSDSAEAYCTFLVRDWTVSGNTLDISSLYVDVQLPENVTCREAQLAIYQLDELLDRKVLELTAGEAEGVWTLDGSYTGVTLPELVEDDELSLWLELSLSDGTSIQHCGAQWYLENGQLMLVAG